MRIGKWLWVCVLCCWATAAWAEKETEVKAFADNLAQSVQDILTQEALGAAEKQRKLERLFDNHVDIDWVSRFALGRYWRTASEQQRRAYQRNYKAFVLKYYTDRLIDHTGQEYRITEVRTTSEEEGEYLLGMELVNTNEPNMLVDYRIREDGDRLKIYDIIIEGVSMITTQRSEFNSVIANKGLDYLIDVLEKKAEAAKS